MRVFTSVTIRFKIRATGPINGPGSLLRSKPIKNYASIEIFWKVEFEFKKNFSFELRKGAGSFGSASNHLVSSCRDIHLNPYESLNLFSRESYNFGKTYQKLDEIPSKHPWKACPYDL